MKKQNGSVVVLCLWLIIIISVLALSLSRRTAIELQWLRYERASLACRNICYNTLVYVQTLLASPEETIRSFLTEGIAIPEESVLQQTVTVQVAVVDEESFFNINMVPEEFMVFLLMASGATAELEKAENIAHDIVLWRSPLNDETDDQTEVFYKHGNVICLEELAFINGIDYNEIQQLQEYVTVWNEDIRVNINSCSEPVLRALEDFFSAPGFSSAVIGMRLEAPLDDTGLETLLREGGFHMLRPWVKVRSRYYRIIIAASCDSVQYTLVALWDDTGKKVQWYGVL